MDSKRKVDRASDKERLQGEAEQIKQRLTALNAAIDAHLKPVSEQPQLQQQQPQPDPPAKAPENEP